jgi:hypothetical protein
MSAAELWLYLVAREQRWFELFVTLRRQSERFAAAGINASAAAGAVEIMLADRARLLRN